MATGRGSQAVKVRITGKVQGVGFRAWTQAQAERFGLAGWVRNEADGSVTALFAGTEAAVAAMLRELWKGPPGSAVHDVSAESAEQAEFPAGFRITR